MLDVCDVVVYKVGFTKEGLIRALEIDLYSNGGYSMDLSLPVCYPILAVLM